MKKILILLFSAAFVVAILSSCAASNKYGCPASKIDRKPFRA